MSSDEGNSGSTGVDDFSQLNTPNAVFGVPDGFDAGRDGFGSGSQAAGAGFSAPSLGNIDNNTTGITAATEDAIGGGSGRPSVGSGLDFGNGFNFSQNILGDLATAVTRGNGTFSNSELNNLSDAIADLNADNTLNSDEDFVDETDDSITGSPLSYSNMVDIQNAVDEAEPTLMSNFFGGRYDAEYDPKNGWQSVNNTTFKDVATSPAAFTLASFGVGAPLGAGTVAKKGFDNLVGKTNQYGSPVMDNTRDYDDDSVLNSLFGVPSGNTFGGGVPFTDAERQQAFGDGGQGDRPPQRRAYFPSGQPAQELAPTDPRAYTNPRFKRNSHSWGPGSGYTFNMADIEEIF